MNPWTIQKWSGPAAPDMGHAHHDGRVELLAEQHDFDCVMLGSFGLSAKAIAGYTGLTRGQVGYRLRKAGVKIQDYRNGTGPFAHMVFQYLDRRAARQLTGQLRVMERNGHEPSEIKN